MEMTYDSVYDLTNGCSGPSTDTDNDGYDSIADGNNVMTTMLL